MPRNGSAISSMPATSRQATSTSDPSSTSVQATSLDTSNAISSQGSADGPTRSGLPGGPTIGPFGQGPVPVSRFRARDNGKAMPTNGTSGPLFTHSSPSAGLQRSLESRLRARLDVNGSPVFALIWKTQDMPSGSPISALRASGRSTSGSASIGWPTPDASGKKGYNKSDSPNAARRPHLASAADLAGWPTPQQDDAATPKTLEQIEASKARAKKRKNGGTAGYRNLNEEAQQVGWPSPQSRDGAKGRSGQVERTGDQVRLSGQTLNGSIAVTGSAGQLNPAFSLWLMGFPPEWESCAPPATRSSRRSRRSS